MMRFFSDFLYKGICCGYSSELHEQVDAIQMSTHNICLYKEVKKKYIGCNLKTTEFLDCALIGVCAVIRSNTVCIFCLMQTILSNTALGNKGNINNSKPHSPCYFRDVSLIFFIFAYSNPLRQNIYTIFTFE